MSNPKAINVSFAIINSLANFLVVNYRYQGGTDVARLVRDLGGKLYNGTSDSVYFPHSVAMIVINEKPFIKNDIGTGPRRNQFDIAHNLGHFILHYKYRKHVLGEHLLEVHAPRYGTDLADRQANCFARGLLMPECQFRAAYDRFSGDHDRLCRLFNTMHRQSEIRAHELNLEVAKAN